MEAAWLKGKQDYKLSSAYSADLKQMYQYNRSDTSKQRPIRRTTVYPSEDDTDEDEPPKKKTKKPKPKAKKTTANKKPLKGLVFCFTGTLSKPRSQMTAMIEGLGGTVKKTVSYAVDYLVKARGQQSNKADAATGKGTKVISEDKLNKLIRQNGGATSDDDDDDDSSSDNFTDCACCGACIPKEKKFEDSWNDGTYYCDSCAFPCSCDFRTAYRDAHCCLEGIGPYCEACWEDPGSNNCECDWDQGGCLVGAKSLKCGCC
eukprot:TRINITY_DN42518_c0_g1_i1.p1 TRINITY_DN42518_c0_g1~~TRINITY_DN42518_c0_g1_i1.p1  ORF type:complete len:301 (-),score=41.14 TRINITY_DN42518_c0_g1_i1:35-814(-)